MSITDSSIEERFVYHPWEIVLCCDYVYCSNKNCSKRHWGMKNYDSRMFRLKKQIQPTSYLDDYKIDERMALYKAIDKLKKKGKQVIIG
jgi:hypothetical protein